MDPAAQLVAFVASTDLERSRAFYESALGLTVIEHNPGAIVFRRDHATLRVTRVHEFVPAPFTVLGFVVDDISRAVADLDSEGIQVIRYPGIEQDERGVWNTPGGDFVLWFNDPDRNVLSVTQSSS